MKLWDLLLYLTNNEESSRHEQQFDIVFLVINTIALVFGVIFLRISSEIINVPCIMYQVSCSSFLRLDT